MYVKQEQVPDHFQLTMAKKVLEIEIQSLYSFPNQKMASWWRDFGDKKFHYLSCFFTVISNMVVLQVLKDFAAATSIHGLAFIVDIRLSVAKRVAWSLIFTAAIMWASIQLQFAVTSKLRVDFLRIRLRHKSLLFFWL